MNVALLTSDSLKQGTILKGTMAFIVYKYYRSFQRLLEGGLANVNLVIHDISSTSNFFFNRIESPSLR